MFMFDFIISFYYYIDTKTINQSRKPLLKVESLKRKGPKLRVSIRRVRSKIEPNPKKSKIHFFL